MKWVLAVVMVMLLAPQVHALTATASSAELNDKGEPAGAGYAVDGVTNTRWSSEFSDPQWLCVDLGREKEISTVIIVWENAYAASYEIQVSKDGKGWQGVYKEESGKGGLDIITFSPVKTKFVRVYCTQRATEWGNSIWELAVK